MPTYTALQEVKKVYKGDVQIRPDPVIAYRPMKVDGADHGPNGFNLTDHGTMYTTLGTVQCAYFDGNSYADTYLTGMWSGAPDFTMSFWVNLNTYSNGPTLVFTGDQGGTASAGLWTSANGVNGDLYVGGWDNDRNTSTLMHATDWNNVVMTHHNGEVKVYHNGLLRYTGSVNFSITSAYCVIGRALGAWGNCNGYFNEVMIQSVVWDSAKVVSYWSEQAPLHGL